MMAGKRWKVVGCLTLLLALAGPVSSASASDRSIRQALRSYDGKIVIAEGHVASAIETYKTEATPEPAPVVTAIDESIDVISRLRTKVREQGAIAPRVKMARHLIVAGLGSVIAAYERLKTAFSEKTIDLEAAKAEAEKAVHDIQRAHAELKRGVKMLG